MSQIGTTGRYSPLRYPGGKGKIAKFMASVVRANGLSDGQYIEPYAGGAGIACELLITGVVRRIVLNDISPHISAFWNCVVNHTDDLCQKIQEIPLSVEEWDRQKAVFARPKHSSTVDLGFSCFYLNRTNRSGILNAGPIGGRDQNSKWSLDARFNRTDLICRIRKIAQHAGRIEISCKDAVAFLRERWKSLDKLDMIYLDPPYFEKGRMLYYDAYEPNDHADVAKLLSELKETRWVVSYDDVEEIRRLYSRSTCVKYLIRYSAKRRYRGREIMFFSKGMEIPELLAPMHTARSTQDLD